MSTLPWTEDSPGAREFPAYCRGCSKPIRKLNTPTELWEDPSGVTVCVKAPLKDAAAGQRPDYVFHRPMPDGLVGAPPPS